MLQYVYDSLDARILRGRVQSCCIPIDCEKGARQNLAFWFVKLVTSVEGLRIYTRRARTGMPKNDHA